MTKLNRIILVTIAALTGTVVANNAIAAGQADCRIYAQQAVLQYNKMQAWNRGCTGFRWHNWYDGHYRWCRDVSKDAARAEYFVRQNTIMGNGPC
jgi:hypothetical protein